MCAMQKFSTVLEGYSFATSNTIAEQSSNHQDSRSRAETVPFWNEPSTRGLLKPDRVTAANRPVPNDSSIDSDIGLVVLGRRAQKVDRFCVWVRILKRRHYLDSWNRHPQEDLVRRENHFPLMVLGGSDKIPVCPSAMSAVRSCRKPSGKWRSSWPRGGRRN